MRTVSKDARYPKVRRGFGSLEEIAEVINRSVTYVSVRMIRKGFDFTRREKILITEYLGGTAEATGEYFPE